MSEHSYLISQMTWSFSRIMCFEQCPYKFFLSYVSPVDKQRQFFSDFGTFMHHILAEYNAGNLKRKELVSYYSCSFFTQVVGKPPSQEILKKYFLQGMDYLSSIPERPKGIVGIERNVDFNINGYPFTGFIDLIVQHHNKLCIVDHKSHQLKPRSNREKPTRSDKELDQYLRQLYLYSAGVEALYGRLPSTLAFNSYRTKTIAVESFSPVAFQQTKEWAVSTIERIMNCDQWHPQMDYYFCKHICDVQHECEYYQINHGK